MCPELEKSMLITEKNLVLRDILQFVGDTLHIAYEIQGSFENRQAYVIFTKHNCRIFLELNNYYNQYMELIHSINSQHYYDKSSEYYTIIHKIGYCMITEIEHFWLEWLRSK